MRSLAAIAALFCAFGLASAEFDFETVTTQNGRITGHRAPKAGDVWEYLGIPYAQPPIGDLRFAAPQEYNKTGPYKATHFVRPCFRNGNTDMLN